MVGLGKWLAPFYAIFILVVPGRALLANHFCEEVITAAGNQFFNQWLEHHLGLTSESPLIEQLKQTRVIEILTHVNKNPERPIPIDMDWYQQNADIQLNILSSLKSADDRILEGVKSRLEMLEKYLDKRPPYTLIRGLILLMKASIERQIGSPPFVWRSSFREASSNMQTAAELIDSNHQTLSLLWNAVGVSAELGGNPKAASWSYLQAKNISEALRVSIEGQSQMSAEAKIDRFYRGWVDANFPGGLRASTFSISSSPPVRSAIAEILTEEIFIPNQEVYKRLGEIDGVDSDPERILKKVSDISDQEKVFLMIAAARYAQLLDQQGKPSMSAWNRVIELEPGSFDLSTDVNRLLALAYEEVGNYSKSAKLFNEAGDIDRLLRVRRKEAAAAPKSKPNSESKNPSTSLSEKDKEKIQTAFKTLEIPETATASEIQSAFRKAAFKTHTDTSHDRTSTQKFIDIKDAYETLKKFGYV